MWGLRLLCLVVVLRWRFKALAVGVGLVAWVAVGPWACWSVIAAGLLGPVVLRVRRDGVALGRWFR